MGRERCETVEDPWNTTEKRSFHIDYLEGRAVAGPGRGLSLGRSRSSSNHHVCVFVYKHEVSYTQAAERATDRRKMTASLPLSLEKTRTRATTKTGEGDSAPHKHAIAARPSTRPAGAESPRALQADSAPPTYHTSKGTHHKQPLKK